MLFFFFGSISFLLFIVSGKQFKGQELRAAWAEPINKEEEARRREEQQNRRAKMDDNKTKKKKKKVQGMSLINLTPKNAIGPSPNALLAKPPTTDNQFQGNSLLLKFLVFDSHN